MMWSKALFFQFVFEFYLPWAGLGWAGPHRTCIILLLSFFPLLHYRHCFWDKLGFCILTLMNLASCRLPAAGVFFSVPDVSKNELCPLEANSRELGNTADCTSFLFQPLVAILLPIICYLWFLGPQRYPAILLFRMWKAFTILPFSFLT